MKTPHENDEFDEKSASRTRGFTLIEVMMVVAILGLTLVLGFPSFIKAMNREGMRKAQGDLLEACRDARRTAIMTGKDSELVFHPLDGTFGVAGQTQAKLPQNITIDILGVNFVQFEHQNEARVEFHPNGTSDEFTMVVSGADGSQMELTLEPITALAEMKQTR